MLLSRGRKPLLLGVSIAAMAAGAAHAAAAADQTPAPASTPAPAADARPAGLQEIVVTARKRAENLQVAPVSISAATGATLEKAHITRLDDLSSVGPGVRLTETVGYPAAVNIYIRGIGSSDPILTSDSPVALYVDGVYLGRQAGALLELSDIDHVELLRGPQGSLFGRNTTGGAVSVFTRSPSEQFGAKAEIGYASNNEFTGMASIDTGDIAGSGVSARLTYRHHQMDGYVRNLNTSWANSPGADNANQVVFALHIASFRNLTIDYKFDYLKDSLVTDHFQLTEATPNVVNYFSLSPTYGGGVFEAPSSKFQSSFYGPVQPRAENDVYGHSLTVNYYVNEGLKLKSITGYRGFYDNDTSDLSGSGPLKGYTSVCPPAFGSPLCSVPETLQTVALYAAPYDRQHQYQISEEVQAGGKIGDWNYVVGLFYFDEHAGENEPSTITIPLDTIGFPAAYGYETQAYNTVSTLFYDVTSQSEAAFSQVSWAPSQIFDGKLEITGGGRYTHDAKTLNQDDTNAVRKLKAAFDNWSESASVKYQWTHDFMTYARWSTGYKAGGWSARAPINGFDPTGLGAYLPEQAMSYEVGFKGEFFDRRVRLNADLYNTDYNNLQVSSLTTVNGALITTVNNAGKANYKGAEVEFTVLPATGWQIDGNFAYVDPRYLSYLVVVKDASGVGHQVNIANLATYGFTSKITANADVQYTFPRQSFGDLTLRMDWQYATPRYFTQGDFDYNSTTQSAEKQVIPGLPYVVSATKAPTWNSIGAQVILDNIPIQHAGHWKVTLYAKNLLDDHPYISGLDLTSLGFIDGAWGRGRVIGVDLSAKF